MAQQQMNFASDFVPELEELMGSSDSEDEDINEFVPVNASFDKFNESFGKDQEFWKNAYETLDDDEYEKLVRDNVLKKKNDFNKFNETFSQQSEFWTQASGTLDEDKFEKLVEEECSLQPFSQSVQMDIDFQPYLNLFKRGDKFWNLATKNLKDDEYEKLVKIYIASEKITWSNLTSDVFIKKPPKLPEAGAEAAEDQKQKTGEAEEDVKPFVCDICPKTFKLSNQLRLHKEFNHSQDRPLTCNFCFRQFKQFDALQKHRQMHTEF